MSSVILDRKVKNRKVPITSVERTRKLSVLLHKAAASMQQQRAMVCLQNFLKNSCEIKLHIEVLLNYEKD